MPGQSYVFQVRCYTLCGFGVIRARVTGVLLYFRSPSFSKKNQIKKRVFYFAKYKTKEARLLLHSGIYIFSIYYIHTEKYLPKSYVVNFRTQISSSQSEERTMVFTREKNDTSNQNRERCFFHV